MCSKIKNFNFPGAISESQTLITGIRKIHDCEYIITGFYQISTITDFPTVSFVFKGCLSQKGKWYILNYPGEGTVTNLYGPNVKKCNNYSIVGNIVLPNETNTIAVIYNGKLNNSGIWEIIIPSTLSNDAILNSIAHSNAGSITVGNYDTIIIQGKAFLYNIKNNKYTNIVPPINYVSITAYGIVKNCKHKYTITGGIAIPGDQETSYLVDYDSKNNTFKNWNYYRYNNDSNILITHSDGISHYGKCSYSLTGVYISGGIPHAFFSTIKRTKSGTFSKNANWKTIVIPNSIAVTGNSISESTVIGVYSLSSDPITVNGYSIKI